MHLDRRSLVCGVSGKRLSNSEPVSRPRLRFAAERLKFVSPALAVSTDALFTSKPYASTVTLYVPAVTAISYLPSFCEKRLIVFMPDLALTTAPRTGLPEVSVTMPLITKVEAAKLHEAHKTARTPD